MSCGICEGVDRPSKTITSGPLSSPVSWKKAWRQSEHSAGSHRLWVCPALRISRLSSAKRINSTTVDSETHRSSGFPTPLSSSMKSSQIGDRYKRSHLPDVLMQSGDQIYRAAPGGPLRDS